MKAIFPYFMILCGTVLPLSAMEESEGKSVEEIHAEGSERLADEQDELSADVQQLVIEQTLSQVIELLGKVEGIMDETTDYLIEPDTGGKTIAAQTEIIETIKAAAKARQQQSGSKAGGAMMDMLEKMTGEGEGEGEGDEKEGEKAGDKGGEGQTGESDEENTANGGNSGGEVEERTVPKAGGAAGKSLPSEFQDALDAYNRGLEEVGK